MRAIKWKSLFLYSLSVDSFFFYYKHSINDHVIYVIYLYLNYISKSISFPFISLPWCLSLIFFYHHRHHHFCFANYKRFFYHYLLRPCYFLFTIITIKCWCYNYSRILFIFGSIMVEKFSECIVNIDYVYFVFSEDFLRKKLKNVFLFFKRENINFIFSKIESKIHQLSSHSCHFQSVMPLNRFFLLPLILLLPLAIIIIFLR